MSSTSGLAKKGRKTTVSSSTSEDSSRSTSTTCRTPSNLLGAKARSRFVFGKYRQGTWTTAFLRIMNLEFWIFMDLNFFKPVTKMVKGFKVRILEKSRMTWLGPCFWIKIWMTSWSWRLWTTGLGLSWQSRGSYPSCSELFRARGSWILKELAWACRSQKWSAESSWETWQYNL